MTTLDNTRILQFHPRGGDSPMLEIRIACPHCNKHLTTTERVLIGDRFRCPGCQQSFNVRGKDFLTPPAQVFAPQRPPTLPVQGLETLSSVSLPHAPAARPIPVAQTVAPSS